SNLDTAARPRGQETTKQPANADRQRQQQQIVGDQHTGEEDKVTEQVLAVVGQRAVDRERHRRQPESPQPTPEPPHPVTTVTDCSHLVCIAPGRFGAISRHGYPWSTCRISPLTRKAIRLSGSAVWAMSTVDVAYALARCIDCTTTWSRPGSPPTRATRSR